ncbi:GDP-mannose 3,5-epimerase 2 [Histomonas meleagridis]|uniref:GDP-mannose 3,5-epimerase 2 n=1 Tax=Histomonas meleagridis TaxID=135588 RepID=UPI00355A1F04|nr:GDP-mannose 3,5-epimerase 2 [Histomonas meleagridis]KAH0804914.1 GDP-mannose 3,5-epimerase 2 [Histomonas meleagridis]
MSKERVCIGGGAGFIGSHMAMFLRKKGHWVRCVDWHHNEFMKPEEFCDEFLHLDLRTFENCRKATEGCDWVFNFAADMGGMGFIQSNNSVILYNNLMISSNMLEASRVNGVKRFFYSSSACVYPEYKQLEVDVPALKESDAWPAQPQDAYGLEKICTEELCKHYYKDFGIETRVARFHNIYGPWGTWRGGREKAPAAFTRKAILSDKEFEIWGDGLQTRSFTYIDDCIEGVYKLFMSDWREPINIGSDEMISMNDFAKLAMKIEGKDLPLKHLKGPEGVRGRNSDNTLIKKVLGWAPPTTLAEGMKKTHDWIKQQIEEAKARGEDLSDLKTSHVVHLDAVQEVGKTLD